MALIDISVALREGLPPWPGDTPFSCTWTWEIARGASVNVSALSGSPHVGTHADAPVHVDSELAGASELPVDAFVGEAFVVAVAAREGAIELEDLAIAASAIPGGRLLLKTGCTVADGSFPERWPVLSEACARALADRGLRLLGVDAPSVDDRDSQALAVHRALFAGGICVVENLDLRHVEPGRYTLFAAPIKIEGADAAPVRALLQPIAS